MRAQQLLLYPSTGSPFIVVQLQSGTVDVRTWRRPGVGITADQSIQVHHAPPRVVNARVRRQSIMLWSAMARTPEGTLSLPPEPFPLPPIPPGDHDAYVVRGSGNVAIDVPSRSPLVIVNVKNGSAFIANYHGTFVVHVGRGQVHLQDDSGTAAVQVNAGSFFAGNSSFERLRLRTARGDIVLLNCRARQIGVTSLLGSILYDNGSFANGLAHFETTRGTIAIGVNGGAQIVAHAGSGRFLYNPAEIALRRGPQDAQATIDGGGPVVTASTIGGSIALYRGALRDHPVLRRMIPPQLRFF